MTEKLIHVNGIDLCVETFGDASDSPILLIAGAASSMDWWEGEFCERLAGAGHLVIRYDLRDTGRSTSYEPGAPAYTGSDLADDAVALLAALGLSSAHIVGISMGGGLAQRIALDHPGVVRSLTLMATSPGGPGGPSNPDLPPMAAHIAAMFSEPSPDPDWLDREAVLEHFVNGERGFSGSIPVDEKRIREIAGRAFDRTLNMAASQTNHWILEGGEPTRPRLGEITAATLVLHGTEDPLFPLGHGEALAREIPGAYLVPINGMGHQMPPPEVWEIVIPAIAAHCRDAI